MLLRVWREACRHIEVEEAGNAIGDIVRDHLPMERMVVFCFEWERGLATPRTLHRTEGAPGERFLPRTLSPADRRRCQAWIRRREALLHEPGDEPHEVLSLLTDSLVDGSWLVGPLAGEHGAAGALLLRAKPGHRFDASHVEMFETLLEPFSVALDNDRRLQELNALREAAEAEKQSAFSRLGRDSLMDKVVGGSGGLKSVMDRVALVARSDVPVLIMGETGSGKEVIGRAIHQQSRRAKNAFIRVNCGAISPELIDSELFGHEKGAFTGAAAQRRGWFERADEGTLLLDEVGELSLPAQVRLLRVLQEGTFERVGG